jgi:uncharacterized protein
MNDVFHEGECLAQERVGVRDMLAIKGVQLIRNQLTDQHRQFFAQLPFVLVGAVDAGGQPWASALANSPGFMSAPDTRTLHVRARVNMVDPLLTCLTTGAPVGLLGIEAHTRRRNRANGIISEVFKDGYSVAIQQSFGNCPKYIHARKARYVAQSAHPQSVLILPRLDPKARALIRNADTFFIATAYPTTNFLDNGRHGIDVSHRGGSPGFVEIDHNDVLSIPDFVGNSFFNTIGNLMLNPRAGLLFIDFISGDLLHLAVDAKVSWQGNATWEAANATPRLLSFRVREIRRVGASLSLTWESEA